MSQKSTLQLDKNNGLSMDFNFPCNRGSTLDIQELTVFSVFTAVR